MTLSMHAVRARHAFDGAAFAGSGVAAGVTTVRDLGDRDFCVVERRDRQRTGSGLEPTIVASGPPITSVGGHCHFLGGEVAGADAILRAVAVRADRGVDAVKVMASGGVNTPGTDVLATQVRAEELCLVVDRAHDASLPVTAHAHGTPAVEQAIAAGVDGIEHCSCVTAGMLPYAVCELERAGLGVAEELATATASAAGACGLGTRKGRLAAGYDADLLVVPGDLETDLTALLRPHAIQLRGVTVRSAM